jgi:hypothetical protein
VCGECVCVCYHCVLGDRTCPYALAVTRTRTQPHTAHNVFSNYTPAHSPHITHNAFGFSTFDANPSPALHFPVMTAPQSPPRQLYLNWVEEQIEDYKAALSRDELMTLADEAVQQLFDAPDGQIPLTEILLRDVVDMLLFRRLKLPTYNQWLKQRKTNKDEAGRTS